jgi:photosystem II oxygen-evolving enhancer protein 3
MAMTASALSFKAQVAQVSMTAPKRAAAAKAPLCVASAGRREAMQVATFTAGAALFAGKAQAGGVDYVIIDDRKAKQNGFDLIYEARDLEVDQQTGAGGESTRFALQKLSPADTKKRVNEAVARVEKVVPGLIEKEYYPVAQRELRTVVGYLRFDLEFLASLQSDKKAANAAAKAASKGLEDLDFQLRQKSKEGSQKAYTAALASVKAAVSALA